VWNVRKSISKGDYNYSLVPEHPNATKNGYVLEHRIVVENHLNRILNTDEVVHHKNEDKKDNSVGNLIVMCSGEHSKTHGKLKGLSLVDLVCPECENVFTVEKRQCFLIKGTAYTCCSRKCRGKFSRRIQLHGITAKVEEAISGNLLREYKLFQDNSEET